MKYLLILLLFFSYQVDAQIQVRAKINRGSVPNNNQLPQANAGVDKVITLPTNSVTFFGSGTVYVGTAIIYGWVQLSGPSTAALTGSNAATLLAGNLIEGTYVFTLTVTDSLGFTATDNVSVIVNAAINIPPVANAGTDSTITLPINTTTLIGSGTDADGTIISYLWAFQSGSPAFGTITNPTSATTTVTGLSNGTYIFSLTVTDDDGAVGIDYKTVTVNAASGTTDSTGLFAFVLDTVSKVSIGVYRQDSILVRTLVNDTVIQAGTHTLQWDGTDDDGIPIVTPNANYAIKVLSNNVAYQWMGTIGNSSDNQTGNTKHRGYYTCMRSLAFGSTFGYFCTGYSEGAPSWAKFNINTPNTKINILNPTASTSGVEWVCTDNIRVYWGGIDSHADSVTFVFGTNVSNDAYVTFPSGVSFAPQIRPTLNVISKVTTAGSFISGMAVQKTGNFLFITRGKLNKLYVLNKTSGALVQTLTYTAARGVSVDASDNIWMTTGTNSVNKYTVNVDGTITITGIGLGGLVKPTITQVSPDGATVAVLDTALSVQQVKFFNTSTGAAITTLGSAGGYTTNATVSNSKFYFYDYTDSAYYPRWQNFLAYQPDGTFWVNDPGNYRVQHYDASNTFVNRIMLIPASYNVYVDKNNPNKVFANGLEFEVDYTQPLSGTTGWILKRNWGGSLTMRNYNGINYVTTLSNGRTYGVSQKKIPANTVEVVEYDPSLLQIRPTGVTPLGVGTVGLILHSDGAASSHTNAGGVFTYYRYPLLSFNGSNNPVYSSTKDTLAAGTTDNTIGNPVTFPRSQAFNPVTNKFVLFFYNSQTSAGIWHTGYHLGLMQKKQKDNYLFLTEKSTQKGYQGMYPKEGWYDGGNGVNTNGGGNVNYVDRNIITSYHGEFWKGGQTNKFNHYWDNGLAIGQFGTTRYDVAIQGLDPIAAAGMAGNALTATLVKTTGDSMYLWHGDEGDHSAIHLWKITRLNTITEQVITIPYPINYAAPTLTYTNLMAGLPISSTLVNNTNGWTRFPVSDVTGPANQKQANTFILNYDKIYNNDIFMRYLTIVNDTSYVQRDLGTNNVSANWKITGLIGYPGNMPNGNSISQYFEVLDNAGKILTTFYPTINRATGVGNVWGNTQSLFSGSQGTIQSYMAYLKSFEIKIVSGVVTFTYNGLTATTTISNPTGDWTKPKTLRVRFINNGNGQTPYTALVDISNLKFYKDY